MKDRKIFKELKKLIRELDEIGERHPDVFRLMNEYPTEDRYRRLLRRVAVLESKLSD